MDIRGATQLWLLSGRDAMRIGIDGGCLANRRGFGRFSRQLLEALAEAKSPHEFVVFVDRPSAETVRIPDAFERVVVPVTQAPSRAASSTGRRSIADMLAMGRAVAHAGLDIIYFPASYSFFPVWNVGRVVVTLHDTLALAHPGLVFPSLRGRIAWTVKEHTAVRWADRIITVSESARADLIAWFRLAPRRVSVVSEGPAAVFGPRQNGPESNRVLRRFGLEPESPFLLYVGGLSPHKNLRRLVQAFAQSRLADEGVRLVLVGDLGDVFHTHVPELLAEVAERGVESAVIFTGFVPDDDLVFLYNHALALVQPSLMEGFGLPTVEAMACGTPIVASTAGSLREVVGDAGIFFEPTDVDAMAGALRTFRDDSALRTSLAAKALRRAGRFQWSTAAQALLDVFEDLGAAQNRRRRQSA